MRCTRERSEALQASWHQGCTSWLQGALFGVPGAFTPICTKSHLPGFVDDYEKLKGAGAEVVVCTTGAPPPPPLFPYRAHAQQAAPVLGSSEYTSQYIRHWLRCLDSRKKVQHAALLCCALQDVTGPSQQVYQFFSLLQLT